MTQTRLREIGAEELAPQPPLVNQQAQQQANASLQLLLLALKTLSQRTLIAIAALRGMILAGSVFWLAMVIMPEPNTYKLVGLGLYSLFVLILEYVAYRRR